MRSKLAAHILHSLQRVEVGGSVLSGSEAATLDEILLSGLCRLWE